MENFSLQNILNKLTVGTKIDSSCEFLKTYDQNSNSIFDCEEIEAIKRDLENADQADGQKDNLSQKDLMTFYNNAMKKLNSNFKETQPDKIINQLQDWIKIVSAGNASTYAKIKDSKLFQKLTPEQKSYVKEFLQLKDFHEELPDYAADLAAIATPENIGRIKELLQLSINNEKLHPTLIEILLEVDIERQNKTLEIIKENNLNTMRIPGVIKLTEVYEYFPKDILKNNPDFCVEKALDGAAGFKINREANESYLYKPGKGLVEIKNTDAETNMVTITNLEHNTIQKVQTTENSYDEHYVIQEIIKRYDSLEYDEKTKTYKTGNLIETRSFDRADFEEIPTIKVVDANGVEKVLQQAQTLEDGTLFVQKDFTSAQGVNTKVDYKDSPNGLTTMNYTITDKDGKTIMNRELSVKQVTENKFITTVNNKEYEAVFAGTRLFITDKSTNKTKSFDTGKKFITEGRKFVLEILERIPANLLMTMEKLPIKEISLDVDNSSKDYTNNARWSEAQRIIELGHYQEIASEIKNNEKEDVAEYMLATFLHEYGHYLDSDILTGNCEEISSNPALAKIFKEELEAFGKNSTSQQQNYISYFINETDEKRSAQERAAEATMLLNTIPDKQFSTRAAYFQENFPRIIAKINELINQRIENLA